MISDIDKKVGIVIATLAASDSIYRVWFWSHYKSITMQNVLRAEWRVELGAVLQCEVIDGLEAWAVKHGKDNPPTPKAFISFVKPHHTAASINGFKAARQALGIST